MCDSYCVQPPCHLLLDTFLYLRPRIGARFQFRLPITRVPALPIDPHGLLAYSSPVRRHQIPSAPPAAAGSRQRAAAAAAAAAAPHDFTHGRKVTSRFESPLGPTHYSWPGVPSPSHRIPSHLSTPRAAWRRAAMPPIAHLIRLFALLLSQSVVGSRSSFLKTTCSPARCCCAAGPAADRSVL